MNKSWHPPDLSDVVQTGKASDRVEEVLRNAILALELPPGAQLSEQEIARTLSVSRQPVREALIGLARSDLVSIQPKRGTTVSRISAARMLEARTLREIIELAVVGRACASFDPWQRERIGHLLDEQAVAAASDDLARFRLLDHEFHKSLSAGAHFALAWSVLVDIKAQMDRVCNLRLAKAGTVAALVREHREIVDRIDARDRDSAQGAMRRHLEGVLSDMSEIESQNREMFE